MLNNEHNLCQTRLRDQCLLYAFEIIFLRSISDVDICPTIILYRFNNRNFQIGSKRGYPYKNST